MVARGPALGEGARPFTRILGLPDDPTQRAAETQGVLQRLVQGALGYLLRRPHGQRRMARDALGDVTGGGQQLVCRHDPTHQTHPQRRGRVDGVTGQDHLHRHGLRDRPHEALRTATAGEEPARDLREAKAGLWSADPDIAEEGELEPGCQAVPIDRRQQGFWYGERREAPSSAACLDDGCGRGVGGPTALGALFEISASAEGPAGAGDDSDPDVDVLADPL